MVLRAALFRFVRIHLQLIPRITEPLDKETSCVLGHAAENSLCLTPINCLSRYRDVKCEGYPEQVERKKLASKCFSGSVAHHNPIACTFGVRDVMWDHRPEDLTGFLIREGLAL